MQPHASAARVLDRAQHQHTCAARRELEHLLVRDARELACVRDQPRVGGVDAVHVGVDLADRRVERGRQGDGGRVRAAASECRHILVLRQALEAGHDGNLAPLDRGGDPVGPHPDDARLAVARGR